LAIAR